MKPKILICRLSSLGDIVRTIPAVKAIRDIFPDSAIHWLVEDRFSTVIEGLPYVDKLMIVPRSAWRKLSFMERPGAFLSFIRDLKAEQYDMFIDFHGALKSGMYGLLSGISRRIGYPSGIAIEFNTLFTNEKISATPRRMSRYERNFLMPKHFDDSLQQTPADLPISEEDLAFVHSFLKKHGVQSKNFIFMFPGTSYNGRHKRWMPEHYGKLIDLIYEKWRLCTVIGCGPGEESIAEAVQAESTLSPVILKQITIKQLCAVIKEALLFVGGDTGPLHMASLLNTPAVTIFGPSDKVLYEPARFTPFKIVSSEIDCSPCRTRKCSKLECLYTVSPEMVLKAVSGIFAETGIEK